MLLSLHYYECLGAFFLRFVSTVFPLLSEKMLDMISIFLNLLRIVLCRIMWSIFENVPFAFEKNVYCVSLGWKALYISVMSISFRAMFNATISLLIFCMEDLTIFDSSGLKSPNIIVLLSISFLNSSKIFFMYLGAPLLGAYVFTMFMSSWNILPLNIMQSSSRSLFMALFWSLFCWIWVLLPQLFFFSCLLSWNTYFQPFTFSLCRSFVLRWVSCRQHMCGSYFLIHSAILCLFIGAFNPFTFKVITDR